MTKQEMQAEVEQLKSRIAELERESQEPEDARWKPTRGGKYWCVSGEDVDYYTWSEDDVDTSLFARGNVFRTRAEAEQHRLRHESMAQRWRPPTYETYYYFRSVEKTVGQTSFRATNVYDLALFAMGNCHATREAAEAWGAKFGAAWAALLKDGGDA